MEKMKSLLVVWFWLNLMILILGLNERLVVSASSSSLKPNSPEFIIGNLLPDLETKRSLMLSNNMSSSSSSSGVNKQTCPNKLSSVVYAINFASEKLSQMLLDLYRCNFNLNPANTNCDVAYGTRSFFELAKDIKKTLIVFGGSCDTTIKPIAESVQFFNLSLLSYTETDPTFSDPSKYNGFFRMVPSEEQHNHLRIHLIKQHNWTRIGTIYQTQAKYALAHNQLIRELDKIANLTISRSILENQTMNQYESILNDFKLNDIKIIIGIFDISTTMKLFCEIYKKKMYGENYQWIILGGYNQELAFYSSSSNGYNHHHHHHHHLGIDCSVEQMLIALNGTLQTRVVQYSYEYEDTSIEEKRTNEKLMNDKPSLSLSKQAQLDKKYADLVDLYIERFTDTFDRHATSRCLYSYFHGYAFDVLLAIYKVFSTLIENRRFSCSNPGFKRNIEWFNLVNSVFKKISFKGVTGNVSFSNGSRIGQTKLEQLIATYVDDDSENGRRIDLKESLIFVHDQNDNKFYGFNKIKWHGKNPPRDQTIKISVLLKIPKSIFVGMSMLASTGIILALVFLIFNIKFRKHRFIRMSSPYLNNLIIIGCLFSYTSIFFLGENEDLINKYLFSSICVIRVWLLAIGFTVAFGAMFSKTYRVHAILTNSKLTKKVIKDYKLYGIVVFILIIDVVILLCWQIFDPLQIVRKHYQTNSEGEKMEVIDNLVCESNYMKLWIGSLFTFKSLLILFGCFFAYETRHVTISALNDSQYIGISVYNVLIMCSAGAAIAFIVRDKISAFILITLFIFACTTITLCLVFLPKVIEVKKDPTGKKKQKPKNNFKKVEKKDSAPRFNDMNELDRKINFLVEDNRSKKSIIDQISSKLENLMKRAQSLGLNYYEECVKHINMHCEDEASDLKKIIERFTFMQSASGADGGVGVVLYSGEKTTTTTTASPNALDEDGDLKVPVELTNGETPRAANNSSSNDDEKDEEKEETEYVVEEPDDDDDEEEEDDEDEEDEDDDDDDEDDKNHRLIIDPPAVMITEFDDKNREKQATVTDTVEKNLILMDRDGQSTLVKRYSKRTFNPPPRIIDLNLNDATIVDGSINSEHFTFKMDI